MRNIFGWLPIVKGTTPIAADIASVATDNITSTNLQSDKQQIDTKLLGYTVTESSAGITTLDVNSNHTQRTTGTTTHTYVLPVTSTLTLNREYEFVNDSTGIVTIKASNTTSTVVEVQPGTTVIVKCISLSGTDETSWKVISFGTPLNETPQLFNSEIKFDANYGSFNENEYTQTDDITFSINWTGAKFGNITQLIIIGNGDSIILPLGLESVINNSSCIDYGSILTTVNGVRYRIMFECSDVANEKYNCFIIDSPLVSVTPQLNAPVLSTPSVISGARINLQFTDTNSSPNESGVEIQYDTANTFDIDPQSIIIDADETTASVANLDFNTEYFFRVRALGDNVNSANSIWSNIESATTLTTNIVAQDSFTGTTIDTGKWTETDPSDGVEITQNNTLIFTINKASAVASTNTNRVDSVQNITNGCVQVTMSGSSNGNESSAVISLFSSLSSPIYAASIIRPSGVATNAYLRIIINDSQVYYVDSGVSFYGTWRIRFDKYLNNVYFEKLTAPNTWTQYGATQNYDISNGGNNLYCRIGANSIGGSSGNVTFTIDDYYLTNENYSTSNPV